MDTVDSFLTQELKFAFQLVCVQSGEYNIATAKIYRLNRFLSFYHSCI